MESLPIDTSHPAVRDYLSLIRLQVLTPLSLLINIASVVVCAGISTPSLAGISRLHPTSITPHSGILSTYVGTIFLTQIGYCLMLVVTRNAETKKTLVKGVGFSLVFANICMAVWAIAFVMQWFLFSTVLQGLIILALFYSNIALLVYHPPIGWLDTALIHAPMRFFFVLPFAILMPLCLFITLGLTYSPPYPDGPQDYSKWHAWTGFGVIMGTNAVAFLVILLRRDIVWCIAATWICISIWSKRPKPGPVYITVIIFTVLHPLALLSGYVYHLFFKKQGAVIQLPVDEEHPDPYVAGQPGQTASTTIVGNQYQNTAPPANGVRGVPREIDEDATWG